MHLFLRHSSQSEVSEQGAFLYQWHGRTYTESGLYTDTMRGANAEGCDSIVSLRLSLLTDAAVPTIYCFSRRLIMVDHYPWGEDSTRADYAAYRWYHDGTLLPLSTRDVLFSLDGGSYHDLEGCYYVEVPADGARHYWVRSNEICFPINEAATTPVMSVYPNPSAAGTTPMLQTDNVPQGSTFSLHDAYGRKLQSFATTASHHTLPALPPGHYTATLLLPQGTRLTQKIIVR